MVRLLLDEVVVVVLCWEVRNAEDGRGVIEGREERRGVAFVAGWCEGRGAIDDRCCCCRTLDALEDEAPDEFGTIVRRLVRDVDVVRDDVDDVDVVVVVVVDDALSWLIS